MVQVSQNCWWAFDWPRYSKGEYADEQAHARAMKLGVWSGTFTYPWEWRAERRHNATEPPVAN
jgi:endonuclease YncB( thermonuclease family)